MMLGIAATAVAWKAAMRASAGVLRFTKPSTARLLLWLARLTSTWPRAPRDKVWAWGHVLGVQGTSEPTRMTRVEQSVSAQPGLQAVVTRCNTTRAPDTRSSTTSEPGRTSEPIWPRYLPYNENAFTHKAAQQLSPGVQVQSSRGLQAQGSRLRIATLKVSA